MNLRIALRLMARPPSLRHSSMRMRLCLNLLLNCRAVTIVFAVCVIRLSDTLQDYDLFYGTGCRQDLIQEA